MNSDRLMCRMRYLARDRRRDVVQHRPVQRSVNIRADIVFADVPLELRLLHQFGRLRPGPAQQHDPAGHPQFVGELLKREQAAGVNRRHIPQANDDHGFQVVDPFAGI